MKVSIFLGRILSWALTIGLFLVILELCSRLDDYLKWKAPFWGEYSENLLSNTDSLGYRNVPNAKFEKWHIDSLGFRGPEVTLGKPPGVIRVMVLGASETFGLYESQDKEYPAQMQQILDSLYPGRFQVINAASAGMTLPRVTRYFKDYLYKFSPDIVIYYPTPSQYLSSPPPQAETTKYISHIMKKRISSRLLAKASIVLKNSIPAWMQTQVRLIQIQLEVRKHPPGWVFEHPPPELIPLFRDQLSELSSIVQKARAHFILATHGSISGDVSNAIYRSYMIGARKLQPRSSEACLLEIDEEINTSIKEFSLANNIPLVNIDSIIPRNPDYYADHIHFTDRGANLAASAFAKSLIGAIANNGSPPHKYP